LKCCQINYQDIANKYEAALKLTDKFLEKATGLESALGNKDAQEKRKQLRESLKVGDCGGFVGGWLVALDHPAVI
jgi:hypothetical protein